VGTPAAADDSSQDKDKAPSKPAQTTQADEKAKPAPTPAPPHDGKTLTAEEISRYMAPYVGGVRQCYERHAIRDRRADGRVRLEMIVRRTGRVIGLHVITPNITNKRFVECVESLAAEWSFPPRPNRTAVALPFLFLRTHAPGSGPVLSCWNPRGCPTPNAKAPQAQTPAAPASKPADAPAPNNDQGVKK
jgi:hypothetical protein